MAAIPQRSILTEAEYLALDSQEHIRYGFYDGLVIPLAGTSRNHNRIVLDLGAALSTALRGQPCEVFTEQVRLHISEAQAYVYPDIMVVCGQVELSAQGRETVVNPTVVIEVISESTEKDDRGRKFHAYQACPSIREIVLISQRRMLIDHYRRHGDQWLYSIYASANAQLDLTSVGCSLPLTDIYRRVSFDAADEDA